MYVFMVVFYIVQFHCNVFVLQIISQHPYAEAIGEPYVWTVDMKNLTEVERALNAILNQTVGTF